MGGEVAAPIFKKVAEPILRYMSIPPDAPSYAPQYTVKEEVKPNLERMLKPNTSTTGRFEPKYVVADFRPRAFSDDADFGETVVPDFEGKSLREVTQDCLKA